MTFPVFGPYDNSEFQDSYYYQDDYTYRIWIPPEYLVGLASEFTVTLGFHTSGSVYVDAVCIDNTVSDVASSDFGGTPTSVLFGGETDVTITGVTVTSDTVVHTIDSAKGVIISIETGASHSYVPRNTTDFPNAVTYRDAGNFGCSGSFVADYTYTGEIFAVLAITGSVGAVILDKRLSELQRDQWVLGAHLEPAEDHSMAYGPLSDMESTATGVQANAVAGNLSALEGEATAIPWEWETCQLDGLLPSLEGEAAFGVRASLDAELPTLELESRTGSRMEGKLPVLESEGSVSIDPVITLDSKLPDLEGIGYTGANLDRTLSDLRIEAEVTGGLIGTLDKSLPGLTCEATMSTPGLGVLDKDLPALEIDASGSLNVVGTLDGKLSALRIEAECLPGALATLDRTLPDLRLEVTTLEEVLMSVDVDLPTLIMASDAGGGSDAPGGYLRDKSRFEDEILRYSRW